MGRLYNRSKAQYDKACDSRACVPSQYHVVWVCSNKTAGYEIEQIIYYIKGQRNSLPVYFSPCLLRQTSALMLCSLYFDIFNADFIISLYRIIYYTYLHICCNYYSISLSWSFLKCVLACLGKSLSKRPHLLPQVNQILSYPWLFTLNRILGTTNIKNHNFDVKKEWKLKKGRGVDGKASFLVDFTLENHLISE